MLIGTAVRIGRESPAIVESTTTNNYKVEIETFVEVRKWSAIPAKESLRAFQLGTM